MLLILAHGGTWDRRFQISSLAATSCAAGRPVHLVLFFGALDAWARGEWDRLDPAPPLTADTLGPVAPSLTEILDHARLAPAPGCLRLYACSASMRFLELPAAEVQERVDVIAGWQTFQKMTFEAERVVTL